MAFGDKLKEIREQQNLSQLEVANALGVSDRTVSVWERNLKMPNLESAIRLSRFLNVSLDLLIDEQDEFIMKSEAAYGLQDVYKRQFSGSFCSSSFAASFSTSLYIARRFSL